MIFACRQNLQGVKREHVVDPLSIVKNMKKKSSAVAFLQKVRVFSYFVIILIPYQSILLVLFAHVYLINFL